jgi:ferric-dicitrate binding protein FerR (iron transport regulator)
VTESNGAMKAVDRMVDVIRAEEPPELDWEAVERSLLARVRRGEGVRREARPISGVWQALAFAAAAAIVPFALSAEGGSQARPAPSASPRAVDVSQVAAAAGEAGARGERDLGALRTGDAIQAAESAVTFTDGGKVRWTLAPDSGLVVRAPVPASGVGHVVRLTRGSIRVEVQPDLVKHGLVDVLAVEVGQTRIAVHGTVFTVTLRDGEVLVDVEHGVVTVGPTGGRSATMGYQLPAGASAAFSLDGGQKARWIPRDAVRPSEAIAAVPPPRPDADTPLAGASDAPPDRAPEVQALLDRAPDAPSAPDRDTPALLDPPAAADTKDGAGKEPAPSAAAEPPKPTMTAATVHAALLRCFRQAHPSSSVDGPKLTASSTFTLKIRADGSVESAQFSPPLPSIQGCAALVYSGRFQTGTSSYSLSIPVQLSQ